MLKVNFCTSVDVVALASPDTFSFVVQYYDQYCLSDKIEFGHNGEYSYVVLKFNFPNYDIPDLYVACDDIDSVEPIRAIE